MKFFRRGRRAAQFSQFVIVRGEKRLRADLVMEMFYDRPRETEAIERARSTADFIQYDEAARRGVVENIGGLAHFHHEGALAARKIIARANAGENAVHEVNARFGSRDERAGMCEQCDQRDLPDVSTLACHVWSGDQRNLWARGRDILPACIFLVRMLNSR